MRGNLGPGRQPPHLRVINGGGNPPGGGMEERLARLETEVEHMQDGVRELKADMRDVRERVRAVEVKIDHLPGKGFIVTALLLTLAAIAAFIKFAEGLGANIP